MTILDEYLDIPQPGWPGRRRAIAIELGAMLIEGLGLILVLVSIVGAVLLLWASSTPPPA